VFSTRETRRYDVPPPPPPRAPDPPRPSRRPKHVHVRLGTRGSADIHLLLLLVPALLALVAAGFSWYRVAHTLQTAKPVKVPTIHPVSGVVWGGRVFNSRQALTAWLHSRGASYARWASRNPNLARVLETK
jgi:hypothetical protein